MLIREQVARINVCLFCIDANRYGAIKASMNEAKFDALKQYRTSPLFTDAERAALDYVTELTRDKKVKPNTFARMSQYYSEREVCEIVWLVWVVPTAGPASAARQFTRGEKSVSNAKWSPDGKILAFTMDAGDEKDAKPQVWFLYADGGEAWQVTKHKSGVAGYEFSPDGKTLLLVATVPESADEEKRKKVKDDAVVVDHDLKMEHLWTWDIATGAEKQITQGEFTVSDPRWSPDGSQHHVHVEPNPTARR